MPVRQLTLRNFRNLADLDLAVPRGTIAVIGPNGAGKTSLLEAIAVLGNLVSFRPGPPANWVQRGTASFMMAATLERGSSEVELRQQGYLRRSFVRTLHRGARRVGAAEYLELFPVTALSSVDRELITGSPEHRRRFLDRLAFHLRAETFLVLQGYSRALRQRNTLLAAGGGDDQLAAFEHDLAQLGARLVTLRQQALSALEEPLGEELEGLGWSLSRLNLRYHCPDGEAAGDTLATARNLLGSLARARRTERARGHTIVGPHRHDLRLTVHGEPAREVVSAGQGKLLATALKLAAMRVVEKARGEPTTVVFDDVDAELDGRALAHVRSRLDASEQIFLSSAHEETVLPRLGVAAVWRMSTGNVLVEGPGGSAA